MEVIKPRSVRKLISCPYSIGQQAQDFQLLFNSQLLSPRGLLPAASGPQSALPHGQQGLPEVRLTKPATGPFTKIHLQPIELACVRKSVPRELTPLEKLAQEALLLLCHP
jgi:hypothetical protein